MKEFLFVLGWTLLAGAAAIGAVQILNRWFGAPKPTPREPSDKEPASPAATAPRGVHVPVLPSAGPVAHVGATEAYGALLRTVNDMLPSVDLRTVPEQMAADHWSLAGISTAVDQFDATIEAALDAFLTGQPLVRMRLAAGAAQTGELDRAELDAMLADVTA